jgi:hypothetical protein
MISVADNEIEADVDLDLESSLVSKKNDGTMGEFTKESDGQIAGSTTSMVAGSSTMNGSNVIGFSGEVPPPHIERYMSFHGFGDISVSNHGGSSAEDVGAIEEEVQNITSFDKLSTSDMTEVKHQVLATSFDSQQHQFAMDVVNAFMSQATLSFSPDARPSTQRISSLAQGSKASHSCEEIEQTKEIAQVVAEEAITKVGSRLSGTSQPEEALDNFLAASPQATMPQILDTTQRSQDSKLSLSLGDDVNNEGNELTKEEREEMIIEWIGNLWNALLDWTSQQILTFVSLTIATEKSVIGIRSSATRLPQSEPLKEEFSMMLKDLAFECDDGDEEDIEGGSSEVVDGGGSLTKGNMSPQTLRVSSFLSEKVINNSSGNEEGKWTDKFVEHLEYGRKLFEEANQSIDDILLMGRDELDGNNQATKLIFEDMISTLQELATNLYQFYVSNILLGILPSKDVMIEHKPSDINPYLVSALQSNWNSKWWLDIEKRIVPFFSCFKSDISMNNQKIKSTIRDAFYSSLRNVLKRCESQIWQPYWKSRENCQLLIGKENLSLVLAKAEMIMYVAPVTSPSRNGKGTLVTPVKAPTKLAFDPAPVIELIKKIADPKK